MASNQLSDFTSYIEKLCRDHVDIRHSDRKQHFVELNNDQQMQDAKGLYHPIVTLDKLTVNYIGQEDATNKSRYVEMMFLDSTSQKGDFNAIQLIKNKMERVAEDFLKKMKVDRKNRKKFPFLRNLSITDAELNFVENGPMGLYGALLSFVFELPFDETLEDGRFVSLTPES